MARRSDVTGNTIETGSIWGVMVNGPGRVNRCRMTGQAGIRLAGDCVDCIAINASPARATPNRVDMADGTCGIVDIEYRIGAGVTGVTTSVPVKIMRIWMRYPVGMAVQATDIGSRGNDFAYRCIPGFDVDGACRCMTQVTGVLV